MKKSLYWFLLVASLDLFTTLAGLLTNVLHERNGILQSCLGFGGIPLFIIVKMGVTLVCVAMIEYVRRKGVRVGKIYVGCSTVYVATITYSVITQIN